MAAPPPLSNFCADMAAIVGSKMIGVCCGWKPDRGGGGNVLVIGFACSGISGLLFTLPCVYDTKLVGGG